MAYKFQLGAFTASGSITSTDDIDATGDLTGSAIALADASGLAGNVLINNNGLLDLDIAASGGLEASGSKLQIKVAPVAGLETDNNGLKLRLGPAAGLEVSGSGPGELNLKISGSSLTKDGGGIKINTGGVSNDMLSGSIANAKLANSNITVGATAISLGASSTTLDGMTGIDFAAGNASIAASIGGNTLTLGGATSTIAIAGDLTVAGTLERVSQTELLIEDKVVIVASGSANAAAAAGAGLKVDIASGDMSFLYQANGENVGGVDASSSGDIFVASGSAGLIDIQAANFYGNGSNLSGITADSANALFEADTAVSASSKTLDVTVDGTFILINNASSAVTITLDSATNSENMTFKFKKITSNSNAITIQASGSENIDGSQQTVSLDSPYAAVNLYSDGTQWWIY